MKSLKSLLDEQFLLRNTKLELSQNAHPDPIQIASIKKDESISLLCALFAYGNAKNIVKFLNSLDFSLLNLDEKTIKKELKNHIYRFQNSTDIANAFISLRRLKNESSLEEIFISSYKKDQNVMNAVNEILKTLHKINKFSSFGYDFLFGKIFQKEPISPFKRWNMYLRWMVRDDELDFGLWKSVDTKDLLIPLDTHTHKVALKLGLLQRKTYDFKAVLELTSSLKKFDPKDPVKYDFAIYRMGQSGFVKSKS